MQNLTLLIKPASSLCNMRCSYCFYTNISDIRAVKSYGIMQYDTLEVLTRRAFAYADGTLSFVFQGGEPTLAGLEFFKTALKYQKKYNTNKIPVYNSIQTNGILIDEEFAEFFSENRFLVGISLDGFRELHDKYRMLTSGEGSYSKVLNAIELLKRCNVDFNVLCVVNKDIANNPEKTYDNLKKYGFIQFIPMIDGFGCDVSESSLTCDDYGSFLIKTFTRYADDILRGNYVSVRDFDSYINMLLGGAPSSCAMRGSCGGYFVIESDGSAYPCDFYVTDDYKIGNIKESSFFALVKSDIAKSFILDSLKKSTECTECRWYALCRGGCRRHREPFPSKSIFCGAYKSFFNTCYTKMLEVVKKINNTDKKQEK